jgi:hypothetical protein
MNRNNEKNSIYNRLKKIIELSGENEDQLLASLKEQAWIIDFQARDDFEKTLLDLARDTTAKSTRNILYETLVSLEAVWNENIPKKELTSKFWMAYNNKEYDEAGQLYSQLMEQGLDYIDTFELGEGKFLPIETGVIQEILHYNQHELRFLNLELKLTETINFTEEKEIIDVLPPLKRPAGDRNDVDDKLWILLEENKYKRSIVSVDPAGKKVEINSITVPGELRDAYHLSRFHGYLLLAAEGQIFLYDNRNMTWEEWFKEEEKAGAGERKKLKKITCTGLAKDNYWVGLEDGNVRIIRNLERGIRLKFEPLSNRINSIESSEKFVVVTGLDKVVLTDSAGDRQVDQVIEGRAIKSVILNGEYIVTLTSNGMLTGRDIPGGNIAWKINLNGHYDTLFVRGPGVYCVQNTGKIVVLPVPDQNTMYLALESKNIQVLHKPDIRDPEAPVRYLSEFIGRQTILGCIKENPDSHFLITGEAKVGKTSLLNILPELLAGNSVCCYINMERLLMESDSYEQFEKNFIVKCLAQHALRLEDLGFKSGFQCFKAALEIIRGSKRFCVFCLDNFFLPPDKNPGWNEKFGTFLKDMYRLLNSRIILTCRKEEFEDINKKFEEIGQKRDVSRKMDKHILDLFAEKELKYALRNMLHCRQQEVEEIYPWIGNFPYLFQLFKYRTKSTQDHAKEVADNYSKTIFGHFRALSTEANFLIALLFHEELISKNILFDPLFSKYPLLGDIMPKTGLIKIVKEIEQTCTYFKAEIKQDESDFKLHMPTPPKLFQAAADKIPGLSVFIAMNKFRTNPTQKYAREFIYAYRNALKIKGDPQEILPKLLPQDKDPDFNTLKEKYKNDFYIWLITEEGRKTLGMPLTTFIVIHLKPWIQEESIQKFTDLYHLIQAYLKTANIPITGENVSSKCYILLFEFHGTSIETIREEIKGLERISIMSTHTLNEILLGEDIVSGSSEAIFKQLSISERSPYTTTGAVKDLFIGRELEIALIRGLPENIGIFGTRTIGKTSLLLKLYLEIHGLGKWKVYALDCAGIENERYLLEQLALKMEVNIADISTLEKFKNYITGKAEEDNTQYLFLLDEVDGLVAYDINNEERIFKTFNKLCSEPLKKGGAAARFVLFGFQQMYEQMNNPRSRLYNFMVFFPLKALDENSALKLVTQPMKNIYVKWENEQDANYLVKKCSSYPLLLQSACHTLLTILDEKKANRDVIEKADIHQVFARQKFIELCMRFYEPLIKKSQKSRGFFDKHKKSIAWDEEPFFEDIHKIAILALVMRQYEKNRDIFNLTEIQDELKQIGIDLSPGLVQHIIKRLCLNGTLRLIEEPTIISRKGNRTLGEITEKIKPGEEEKSRENIPGEYHVDNPDFYSGKDTNHMIFLYQFGINIFPEILIAHFHGIENCKKELKALVGKESWKKWKKRKEKEV